MHLRYVCYGNFDIGEVLMVMVLVGGRMLMLVVVVVATCDTVLW